MGFRFPSTTTREISNCPKLPSRYLLAAKTGNILQAQRVREYNELRPIPATPLRPPAATQKWAPLWKLTRKLSGTRRRHVVSVCGHLGISQCRGHIAVVSSILLRETPAETKCTHGCEKVPSEMPLSILRDRAVSGNASGAVLGFVLSAVLLLQLSGTPWWRYLRRFQT